MSDDRMSHLLSAIALLTAVLFRFPQSPSTAGLRTGVAAVLLTGAGATVVTAPIVALLWLVT